jgi:hypothetical protein
VSGRDAFEDEMDLLRRRAPEEDELAAFAHSLRATLLAPPSPQRRGALVPRLAEAARSSFAPLPAGAAPATPPAPEWRIPPGRRLRSAVQIALAVALVPLAFAGLAVAGVQVPDAARSAFETVGIELPNQPAADGSEDGGDAGTGADRSRGAGPGAGGAGGKRGNGGAAPGEQGHGRLKPNPAREGGRSQGAQGKGRALGKQGLAPGQNKPKGGSGKGGSAQGNAGGNSGSAPPGQAKKPPSPGGSGSGGGANGNSGAANGNGSANGSPGGKR